MAYVKKNVVTEGLSGKLGDNIVFRQRGGKTIVSVKPTPSERPRSEAQKAQQRRFKAASYYARQATQDPTQRAAYEQRARGLQNPYNLAMADYLNAPDITELDLSTYTGAPGNRLVVQAVDDHTVTEVTVAIYSRNGTLLEQGPAQLHDNGTDWVYTTQQANQTVKGSKLVVQARDLPGNVTEQEEVIR